MVGLGGDFDFWSYGLGGQKSGEEAEEHWTFHAGDCSTGAARGLSRVQFSRGYAAPMRRSPPVVRAVKIKGAQRPSQKQRVKCRSTPQGCARFARGTGEGARPHTI